MENIPKKILFVEDNIVDRIAFEKFSRENPFPYEYVMTGSVEETQKVLESQQFDAAVMDYQLEDGTAFDLFENLGNSPIIVVIDAGNEEVAVRAMKSGAYNYLIKDVERQYLKILPMTLENALTRKQTEEELQKYQKHLEDLVAIRTLALRKEIHVRKQAENELQRSLKEKKVLLRELHHRVINNLQVISSLLDLQAENIWENQTREVFQIARNRIWSMAYIHKQLYTSKNLANIDLDSYLQSLTNELLSSYGDGGIALKTHVSNVSLDIDTAVSCGLIINELVSNALKHAFPHGTGSYTGQSKKIFVTLFPKDPKMISLIVKDNGVGIRNAPGRKHARFFGLRLVEMLARQLKGTMKLDGSHGTTVRITFAAPSQQEE